ncbi:MAG: phosphotransferase enzyme family protein [Cyclobacteriaceae bacterium]
MVEQEHLALVLARFGMASDRCTVSRITTGHINFTYRVDDRGSGKGFVIQRVNNRVFRQPETISRNVRLAADYLNQFHPEYLFLQPIRGLDQQDLQVDPEGWPWRLFPFLPGTYTLDVVSSPAQARIAAAAFGRFNRLLSGMPLAGVEETIPRFHDLTWRWQQFEDACRDAAPGRMTRAARAVEQARSFAPLVDHYRGVTTSGVLVKRIFHNDTKINNLLWQGSTHEPACVIDLDTLMPGYFIYDLGDLVRTLVSPVSEEEKDLEKVMLRKEYYDAVVEGYLSEMRGVLTPGEQQQIAFAGKMMTYIMALRFLSDFLLGDVYYQTHYDDQNLVRASNQLRLLELLSAH